MDARARPTGVFASLAKAASTLIHPLRGSLFLLTLAAVTLVLLQVTPGVPAGIRPYTGYKHWRAKNFLEQADRAHAGGDLGTARLAIGSALALNPSFTRARIQFARLLVDENRFADGAAQAQLAGMDGPAFVHDLLFHSGRYDVLLAYCAKQAEAADRNTGVWLQSALMISRLVSAETRTRVLESLAQPRSPRAHVLAAILLSAADRPDETDTSLAAGESDLDPATVLLGVELLMQTGDTARAWVWLNRHRAPLTDFDAYCGEYRIESARDRPLARRILASFSGPAMSDARWIRLAAWVATAGDAEDALSFSNALAAARPRPSAALAVSAWSLLLLNGQDKEAAIWEQSYRRAGGAELPVLAGRRLADSDRAARSQAVRLLAASSPLPREMIAALLLR